ncbi:hypothetical protein T484DRAFT_1801041, partial [Baffinella frigidus]
MKSAGAGAAEPKSMRNRWDKLQRECEAADVQKSGKMSAEQFRAALARTDPRMTAEQKEWFVEDSSKDPLGKVQYRQYCKSKAAGMSAVERHELQVQYRQYCKSKAAGMSAVERHELQDSAIMSSEMRINMAIRQRFKSLQQAFRRMDEDRDGFLSPQAFRRMDEDRDGFLTPQEFATGVEKRLKEFLQHFRTVPASAALEDGSSDTLPTVELCKLLLQIHGTISDAFADIDTNGDGRLSREELYSAMQRIGVRISLSRVDRMLADMDIDHNRVVDYREFMRKASQVSLADLRGTGQDEVGREEARREEARVRDRMREFYPDAKQAFHAFDKDRDGRLSSEEFTAGLDHLFPRNETLKATTKLQLFRRAGSPLPTWTVMDVDGDGYLAYHEFLARFGVKPKMRLAMSIDQKVRDMLKKKFPDSVWKAFEGMDARGD